MLVRFAVKNFKSFRDKTEFNMLTGDVRRHKNHVKKIGDVEILKAAAIYGANASGKSNLFSVMLYLSGIVEQIDSLDNSVIDTFLLDESFNDTEQEFEVEFVKGDRFFVYTLVIHKSKIILREVLVETFPNSKKEDILILNRDSKANTLELKGEYISSDKDKIRIEVIKEELLDKHKPALKNLCNRGYEDIDFAYGWFNSLTFIGPDSNMDALVKMISKNNQLKNFLTDNIKVSDVGILDFNLAEIPLELFYGENEKEKIANIKARLSEGIESIPIEEGSGSPIAFKENGKEIVRMIGILHSGKHNRNFTLSYESLGTKRFLYLLPAFYILLNYESTVFIDEIESSVHPLYIKELLKKTMAEPDIKGQLIFTSHESNLLDLDIFRQDEIWFTKKDKEGCTKIYSLADYKPRYDFDIKNGYLTGRFGGIPFLGKLEDLDWSNLKPNS
jgi:AAA15 family ATPase/GTPase